MSKIPLAVICACLAWVAAPSMAQAADAVLVAQNTAVRKGKIRVAAVHKTEAMQAVESPSERLSEAELALSERIQTGVVNCDLGANVQITADGNNRGFFHVTAGGKSYYMHPVVSQTGALRLEDTRAGAMWLQLGNKSMLLDQKLGKRVADGCTTDVQRDFAARLQSEGRAQQLLGNPNPPGN